MNTNTAHVQALIDTLAEATNLLSAMIADEAPARRTSRKASTRKAAPKASKARTQAPVTRCLVKGNRRDFVQAHAWAQGLSTLDIAIAVTKAGATLEAGWNIGQGYTERAAQATPAAVKAVKAHLSK